MDFSQLDSLIKISKKKESSQEKKELFSKELVSLYKEERFSENFEKYFYEGFSFLGAKPIFDYLMTSDESSLTYFMDRLTQCKKSKENIKGSALKIFIHFFALFIANSPDAIENISLLIDEIPKKIKNKSGKPNNEFPIIIENYFLPLLNKNTNFPDYSSLNKKSDNLNEFSVLITDVVKKINQKDGSEKEIINNVLNWVNQKPHTELIKNSKTIRVKETENIPNGISTPVSEPVEPLKKEARKPLINRKPLSYLENQDNFLTPSQLEDDEELILLKKTISNKEKEITELKEQILRQQSVLSAFNADKQNSLSEQLNIIASKLKSHYLNYKDAISMDMSIELGENLRDIIGDVFKTLLKSGIYLEEKDKNA